jgi:hypothetical protein
LVLENEPEAVSKCGLRIIVVYTRQEYDALSQMKRWDETAVAGSVILALNNCIITTNFATTWKAFHEPGVQILFKGDVNPVYTDEVSIWSEVQQFDYTVRKAASDTLRKMKYSDTQERTRFKKIFWRVWPLFEQKMNEIMRGVGVYKHQIFEYENEEDFSEPAELYELDYPEPELPITLGKPPPTDETVAKLERDKKTVRLWLNPNRLERGIIREFGLDKRTYEESLYAPRELEERKAQFLAEEELINDPHRKMALRKIHGDAFKALQQAKISKTVGDFLGWPYERKFSDNLQATQHAEQLIRILGDLRRDIEKHKQQIEHKQVHVSRKPTPPQDDDDDDE